MEILRRFFGSNSTEDGDSTEGDSAESGNSVESERTADFYASLLPETIRYGLANTGASLSAAELQTLIPNWYDEALYAAMKLLHADRATQCALLEAVLKEDCIEDTEKICTILRGQFASLLQNTPDTTAQMKKLAQISRVGRSQFHKRLLTMTQDIMETRPTAVHVLMANAMYVHVRDHVAYLRSLQNSPQQYPHQCIYIVDPKQCDDTEIPLFAVTVASGAVSDIRGKSLTAIDTIDDIVYIDDTMNTGNTMDAFLEIWNKQLSMQCTLEDDVYTAIKT